MTVHERVEGPDLDTSGFAGSKSQGTVLAADKMVGEAAQLRREIIVLAERLTRVSDQLYTFARRRQVEHTGALTAISNANRRFAGSVLQGARRTAPFDRHLVAYKQQAVEEAQRRERREATRARPAMKTPKSRDPYRVFTNAEVDPEDSSGWLSDLEAVYGS